MKSYQQKLVETYLAEKKDIGISGVQVKTPEELKKKINDTYIFINGHRIKVVNDSMDDTLIKGLIDKFPDAMLKAASAKKTDKTNIVVDGGKATITAEDGTVLVDGQPLGRIGMLPATNR